MRTAMRTAMVALLVMAAAPAMAAPVAMPGPSYEVLASGPGAGAYPTRADLVTIRYVGRLAKGDEIFSTSADEGRGTTEFPVRGVVPGFSALVQMMRVGDKWRFHLPGYLAYAKPGRTHQPPEPTLKRDVPPDADLIFDVELVAIRPAP